jgi:hypothetical protein
LLAIMLASLMARLSFDTPQDTLLAWGAGSGER